MKDEEMAEEYYYKTYPVTLNIGEEERKKEVIDIFLAGLKTRPQWHKIFESKPSCVEYWDLPQDNLPKFENFYFVKLKNGFVKICELKYDHWSRKKYFYDLRGGKQSDVAEWLDYPTCDKEQIMFEKEAEEYIRKNWDKNVTELKNDIAYQYVKGNPHFYDSAIKQAFQKGAEFGYNKANEWHYVKDEGLPEVEGYYLVFCNNRNKDILVCYIARDNDTGWYSLKGIQDVYAWKEIVLPKE